VNAQLIDARSDAHLWAQTYDRDLADVFAIQSEIAKQIADQLQAKLSPNERAAIEQPPTSDLVAFDLYSRAKTLILDVSFTTIGKENLLQAVELLNQAVARDPTFLLAYCQLATAHGQLYQVWGDHTASRLAAADAAMQVAVRLRPDAGETHLAVAQLRYRGYLDYDGARSELALAQRALPNDPLPFELTGYIDRRQARWKESTRALEHAVELDPRNFRLLQQTAFLYQYLRRYADMAAILDRALTIMPNDAESKVARAYVDFYWRADPRPLHSTIAAILAENPAVSPSIARYWVNLSFWERDLTTADRALKALGDHSFGDNLIDLSRTFGEGLVAHLGQNSAAARTAFTAARAQQEKIVRAQPDYAPALCVLGLIDAQLGRKDDALREGRRALELLPLSRDAIGGPDIVTLFGMICAWTGEKDLALEQLTIGTQNPGSLSYGQLRLDPLWDPLRSDPRFEKIVASLAPKERPK
jgi:tetratricopeptide (TPR) repeat protein